MIGVFVAAVAVGTLRNVSASADILDKNVNAAAEVRFAAALVYRDLQNLYRDKEVEEMRFFGASERSAARGVSSLTFYTVGRAKARYDQPEGDIYEVEYSLIRNDNKSALTRRWWPNPDREAEPGGIVALVAENIDVFGLNFFDGQEWLSEWPEETESVPELVEVLIIAGLDGPEPITETFVVSFPRCAWQQDRGEEEDEEEQSR